RDPARGGRVAYGDRRVVAARPLPERAVQPRLLRPVRRRPGRAGGRGPSRGRSAVRSLRLRARRHDGRDGLQRAPYRLPDRPVFIDPRAHTVYPGEFFHEARKVESGEPEWSDVLDRHEVALVVWPSAGFAGELYGRLL